MRASFWCAEERQPALSGLPEVGLGVGRRSEPVQGVITTGLLSGATIPQNQLLRSFPQYTNVCLDRHAGSVLFL
jgi:hypothetical protein